MDTGISLERNEVELQSTHRFCHTFKNGRNVWLFRLSHFFHILLVLFCIAVYKVHVLYASV